MPKRASARRHAQAIFQIALAKGELERWQADLPKMAQIMLEPAFYQLLENPAIPLAEKVKLLQERLVDVNPLALNLAFLLVDKRRLGILEEIASEYNGMLDTHYGIEQVEVTTALPLIEREKENMRKELETLLGRKVVLDSKVQEDIVGGLILRIKDRLIDGSARTQLKTMEKYLVGIRR